MSAEEVAEEEYVFHVPGEWKWVGTCPCRGADLDCAKRDENWVEVVDDGAAAHGDSADSV